MENEEDKEVTDMELESEEVSSSSHYWTTDLESGSLEEEAEVKESEEDEILASSSEESGICHKSSIKGEQKGLNYNESENETKMVIGNAEDDDAKQRDVKTAESFAKDASSNATNMIKAIDKKVVHQICSGQVIVTLSTAVKELVENAIDAGASSVEIRLIEYGSQLIEVIDNGSGVDEANFQGLALKHHTSKISEFEDLTSVTTFGFRGEALSSLCALSNLTVITKSNTSNSKTGFRIEYNSNGKITSQTPCAREFGTTVILKNIFSPLPVRRQELMKNLKREFHKMVNILYGYCLIAQGVRIMASNQVGNGSSSKIVSVPPSQSIKERILSLFGTKQFQSLIEFRLEETVGDEVLSEFGLSEKTYAADKYTIEGYISLPHQGRSSNDRQFFYLNSRPWDPVKISRIVNEVYHGYSRNQSPFVCLNIRTKEENVDINVTPDKRVLYLQSDKSLYALLKASLISMYAAESSSFNLSATREILTFSQSQSQSDTKSSSNSQTIERLKVNKINNGIGYCGDEKTFACQFSTSSSSSSQNSGGSSRKFSSSIKNDRNYIQSFARKTSGVYGASHSQGSNEDQPYKRCKTEGDSKGFGSQKQPKLWGFQFTSSNSIQVEGKKISKSLDEDEEDDLLIVEDEEDDDNVILIDSQEDLSFDSPIGTQSTYYNSQEGKTQEADNEEIILYDDELGDEEGVEKGPSVSVSIDWNLVRDRLKSRNDKKSAELKEKNYARKFRAKIAPGDNKAAEEELQKQLNKSMFSQMEIIGQFNLGFVMVKYGADLFIVDQHASDEKYNFEDLEKTTVMQTQILISPLELQLPAVSESIIIDNFDIFRKNGFDFEINLEGEPTTRVKLTKIPYSKSCQFGKRDVEELIYMMSDAPEKSFCRPTKVRDMLASRACRKSVMIGTALSVNEMRKIVNHMGEMDQPWNCPHGRPTIRHLMNMNLLPDMDLNSFNH